MNFYRTIQKLALSPAINKSRPWPLCITSQPLYKTAPLTRTMASQPPTSTATTTNPAITPSAPSNTQSHHADKEHVEGVQTQQPLPALPPAGDQSTVLEVNGASVSLADKIGPAVVNADGTMSRISNWAEMTDIEKENTLRVLGKRNKLRLETLRAGQENGGQGK